MSNVTSGTKVQRASNEVKNCVCCQEKIKKSALPNLEFLAHQCNAGSWCSWPNTPPCHGGDRRFESGRARQ